MSGWRSSVGGAGGAAGSGFEARALAWFATYLLARIPLSADWRVQAARVEEVGGQTGQEMDDVGAITDRRGYIFVQAKHRLQLSGDVDKPLSEAVDQAVRQFIDGAPQDSDGSRRLLEPDRDALVIVTDAAGSARVRQHLRKVVTRLATHPQELPLDQLAKNAREREALRVLLDLLRAAFAKRTGGMPSSEEQLREIGRVLHLVTLDLDPDGNDRINAETYLRGVLDDPDAASGAWNDMVALGQQLIESQRWANRDAVRHALALGGHPAGIDPSFRNDVERLRQVTTAVLDTNAPDVTIPAPEGPITIRRDVADLVARADGEFALIGEPGAGKSVLAADLAAELINAGEDVVFLGAESLAGSLGATRTELAMQNNLDQVLRGWDGSRRGTLIIDGIDATRGTSSVDWLPQLARALRGTRWRVVATIRSFDLRYGPSWQQMFPGGPVDTGHADPFFSHVRHVLVGDLTQGEIEQVRRASPRLATLIDTADPRLAELLRNPFNLRLAAELLGNDGEGAALASVRTRQDLLHLYWQRRVELAPDHLARRRAVRDLGASMVQRRRARVADPSAVVAPAVLGAVSGLLHDGVLREDVQGRRSGLSPVVFSHPVLYDFAIAVTCLQGEDHLYLSQRLDDDPDLAITIRPSLDMYLADLWTDDATRTSFWDLAVALSRPNQGQPIAAIAAACAALREHPTYEDLAPIEEQATSSGGSGGAARMCIAYLAGAIEAAEVSQLDRQASASALAELTAKLAVQAAATGDLGMADLARVLLLRLDRQFPLRPNSIAAGARSHAIADVMRCALTNPSEQARETLAIRIGEALVTAAVVDPDYVGRVIEQVIAPPVMAAWGSGVASRLIQRLGNLAQASPELAERLALSVWEFDEKRDEATSIGNSNILGLTSTRLQDLQMARYDTGEAFPAFLAASPEAAMRFFLAIIDKHAPPFKSTRTEGPLPRVYHSTNLEFVSGHSGLNTMARSLADFLVSSAASDDPQKQETADRLIQMAAAQLTHHQAWNYILNVGAANPGTLGRRLIPLLYGSDLFGHPMTRSSAARLTAVLSPVLMTAEHETLEQAILQACNPLRSDANANQDLVDSLLGQLEPGRVQDPAAQARLTELNIRGGPPPVPEPLETLAGFRPYRTRERLAESDALEEADETLLQAMERLEADLTGTASGGTDDQHAARERLRESVLAMYSVLIPADTPIDSRVFETAFNLLVNGARHLAYDAEVLPGSELGEMVFDILRAALPGSDPAGAGS